MSFHQLCARPELIVATGAVVEQTRFVRVSGAPTDIASRVDRCAPLAYRIRLVPTIAALRAARGVDCRLCQPGNLRVRQCSVAEAVERRHRCCNQRSEFLARTRRKLRRQAVDPVQLLGRLLQFEGGSRGRGIGYALKGCVQHPAMGTTAG